MTGAELAARRTAAEAALGDFRREAEAFGVDGALAYRLAGAISDLLAWLELEDGKAPAVAAGSWVGPDGTATLGREDLHLVIAALRAAVDESDSADRYEIAALLYRLGDDHG